MPGSAAGSRSSSYRPSARTHAEHEDRDEHSEQHRHGPAVLPEEGGPRGGKEPGSRCPGSKPAARGRSGAARDETGREPADVIRVAPALAGYAVATLKDLEETCSEAATG
ncbi:hypothetical protein Sdagh_14590 [Streptomyces daghestanicus]|uniref:Uncharacterized protein n=1 Tax=Streptomyces daghestanicus TaxID=66885 RepID=A0ABQ3PXI4_9ACTN|nr:hypothetical protein Sdagh_14590 [Streptomyces daghestanicus]